MVEPDVDDWRNRCSGAGCGERFGVRGGKRQDLTLMPDPDALVNELLKKDIELIEAAR
jgi:hypothetical protein